MCNHLIFNHHQFITEVRNHTCAIYGVETTFFIDYVVIRSKPFLDWHSISGALGDVEGIAAQDTFLRALNTAAIGTHCEAHPARHAPRRVRLIPDQAAGQSRGNTRRVLQLISRQAHSAHTGILAAPVAVMGA